MAWADAPAHRAYDIAIVGAGAMGASAAFHIASDPGFAGRLLVLERDPSFERAATSLTNSCIRQQFSTAVNIRVSQWGADFLARFPEAIGDARAPEIPIEGFGYLYLAATEAGAESLRAAQALQASLGVGTRLLSPQALAARFPFLETADIRLASHNPGREGYFDGGAMIAWFRRRARDLGAEFVAAEVGGLSLRGGRVTGLRLASGAEIAAGTVVVAAGTRAAALAATAGRSLPIEARRRYTVVFDAAAMPEPLPLVIDPTGVHVRQDGAGYLCGFAPEADGPCDPDDFAWADAFEERAWPALAARIPAFERLRPRTAWVGHYEYNTLDQNGVIGPDPEIPGLFHLCGFSGHGLQQAPAMGQGAADLLLAGRPLRERAVI